MGVTIRGIDQEEFEQYPEPKTAVQPDPYADLIPLLESQGFVEVTVTGDTTMRGARIAIGRRAKFAGIDIQMRSAESRPAAAGRRHRVHTAQTPRPAP
jgi:hypothetical protein